MKPRKWVLISGCLILVCAVALYQGIAAVEKNKDIERMLIRRLSLSTGGEFSVGSVRLGFFSVYLRNVKASLSMHSYNVTVRDIKIAFSLWKFVRSRGDVAKSISKIILISPALDIRLRQTAQPPPVPPPGGMAFASLWKFPVEYLLVRKGTIRFFAASGSAIVVGEDLSGRIREDDSCVSMELRGKMASRRNNLFCGAAFSKTGQKHRISLRLDKAQIQKPLRIMKAEITSGICDGVFEFSFPDSVSAATFEANGWVHVSRGTCTLDGVRSPLTSIGLMMNLSNTVWRVDSLKCEWNRAVLSGKGTWNMANTGAGATKMVFHVSGIRPELYPFLPAAVSRNIGGMGWAEFSVVRKKTSEENQIQFTAGGLSFYGISVRAVRGSASFDKGQITLDSMKITGPLIKGSASGIGSIEKNPIAYSMSFACSMDTIPFVPGLAGQCGLQGTLHGLGQTVFLEGVVSGSSLSYAGVALGSPQIRISSSQPDVLSFSSIQSKSPYVTVAGQIDSMTSGSASMTTVVSLGKTTMKSLLGRISSQAAKAVDSAWATLSVHAGLGVFSARGQTGLFVPAAGSLPPVLGTVAFQIDKEKKDGAARWQIVQRDLTVSDSLFPIRGQGLLWTDSLRIDSLSLFSGVRGAGRARFGASGDIDMTLKYRDVPLGGLLARLLRRPAPVRKGVFSGTTRVWGPLSSPRTESDVHVRGCDFGGLPNIETDVVAYTRDTALTILPVVIRQNGRVLVSLDTMTSKSGMRLSGIFKEVDIPSVIVPMLPEEFFRTHRIEGRVSGGFISSSSPFAVNVELHSKGIVMDKWGLDSVTARLILDAKGITIASLRAQDSLRSRLFGNGFIPWSTVSNEQGDEDSVRAQLRVEGDLLASLEHNVSEPYNVPISGHGRGTLEVWFSGSGGSVRVVKASVQISQGVLQAKPYVPEDIKDFSLRMTMDSTGKSYREIDTSDDDNASERMKLSLVINGMIGRRPVQIHSTHSIPKGFEPITIGSFDFGAICIATPHRGVDIHIPRLQEKEATVDVEFAAKAPFPEFALSGPLDRLCITGTWILRNCDFTYPKIKSEQVSSFSSSDPLSYVTWNLDVKPGNRKVKYFYDTGKNRNLMRFVECYVDPVSVFSLRGREADNTFKIHGALRSTKGSVFFGRTFDRNFDVGLDFIPQPVQGKNAWDNRPIIWGTAEALSDTNRFERVRLTLITRDSVTNAWSEKGRLYDIHFRVGSDIEEIPGEGEKRFMTEEGKKYGSAEGAGKFVSGLGEQYLHRILFQNIERRLAKGLGLDVINVETSIASNYFNKLYNRQSDANKWDYLAFANVGITLGRYIFYDKVFLKWRADLVPVDTLLQPEYNVGFEIQPLQYLLMDVNYGIHQGEKSLEYNPQVNLRLELPIKDFRKYFDF